MTTAPTNLSIEDLLRHQIPPPPFGHEMLKYFMFDHEYTNLNHGSYGSPPRPVHKSCLDLTAEIESNPDLFNRITATPMLAGVRSSIASLVGAAAEDVVIVGNASLGVNTVLQNLLWDKDDTLVVCNTTYNSVNRTAHFISDSPPHPKVEKIELIFPTSNASIIQLYMKTLELLSDARKKRGGKGKIVVIIDSIVSNPGIHLPWKDLVKICKKLDMISIVDGAHSVGQELNLELEASGVDFFISNCHKWLLTKRACAFLYVPKRNQHYIRSSFPTPFNYLSPHERASHPENFIEQFNWNGTIDMVPYLSVIPALKFRNWIGGEEAISTYCHNLAIEGGKRLAELLGTELMDPNGEQTLNMTNVGIPLPASLPMTDIIDNMITEKCLIQRKIFAPVFKHGGKWWCRVSVQIWVEMQDFEIFAKVLKEVCFEISQETNEVGDEKFKYSSKVVEFNDVIFDV